MRAFPIPVDEQKSEHPVILLAKQALLLDEIIAYADRHADNDELAQVRSWALQAEQHRVNASIAVVHEEQRTRSLKNLLAWKQS